MLFQKTEHLSKELFQNPPARYRGAPFWAWNCKMTKEAIDHTLEELQEMGMGGAHIHCRTGMANEYLGKEFMELVKYTNQQAQIRNMLTWLYDEDRWPSGAAGGLVTKDTEHRIRFLVFSPAVLEGRKVTSSNLSSSGQAVRSENRRLVARYQVKLENGFLCSYKELNDCEQAEAGYKEWHAHLEISGDNPWFNNQAYLNTLDKAAVKRFIEVTHEAYYKELGDEFGKSVPAIFTDEPQFSHKTRFGFAEEEKEITIPFTDDLEETFEETYGHSLLEKLPEIFWELGENFTACHGQTSYANNGLYLTQKPYVNVFSKIRYEYHNHICERFVRAFADTIGDWCGEHNLLFTGHMMEEPTLESQTAALGEAMRSYRSFTLPGIDILCNQRELSTAKQAQSVAHQYDRPGIISELYGVTNWDFDFRGHKLQGDWQAALGVLVRVPHLTWTSMAGEAKRDYPASIGYQSPWYKEYSYIENYFARLGSVLSRGKAEVKVGVIHPIESYWLYWGPEEQTGSIRREMDENFEKLIHWLLYGLIDFDFLSESLLPDLTKVSYICDGKLEAGAMEYDTIIVPNCITIRKTTLDVLEKFQEAGGKLIFTGNVPKFVDVSPSNCAEKLAEESKCIPFNRHELLKALEQVRLIDIRDEKGNPTDNIIYQMRKEKENRWLFLSHVEPMKNPDIPQVEKLTIKIKGTWNITCYDAMTGEIYPYIANHKSGTTIIFKEMYEHDSLLLYLEPAIECEIKAIEKKPSELEKSGRRTKKTLLPIDIPVSLSEPNVYLLDMARYRFDESEWQEREEILRIDNKFRRKLGYSFRMEAFAQPWLNQEYEPYCHKLSLMFTIFSEIDIAKPQLALENGADTYVYLNGKKADNHITGWYIDRAIDVIELPALCQGQNKLIVEIPYNSKRNVEVMYLLGEFGVTVAGSTARIIKPVKTLTFGDITTQGLPFYGGNLTYHLEAVTEEVQLELQVSMFRNPVIKASVDGEEKGYIAFSPYRLSLGKVEKGIHRIDLTAFGNRINTFGTVHNCNQTEKWIGPNAWRSEETSWSYEYQLKPTGILKTPILIQKTGE